MFQTFYFFIHSVWNLSTFQITFSLNDFQTFICFECVPMRNLCTESRLLNHRTKFHRGANSGFKCNLCSMKCLTPRKLRKHKKMAHVFTKTYQCHFCDELFTSEVSVSFFLAVFLWVLRDFCKWCFCRLLHMSEFTLGSSSLSVVYATSSVTDM